jgi:acyl-CoA thioesterase I
MLMRSIRYLAVAFAVVALCGAASAKTINILAIGASNTAGRGVSNTQAWPAVLQSMLRSKGYDAHVTVRAFDGLTSTQIMSYTNSIPAGTQIVIFDLGVSSDRRHNIPLSQSAANQAEIVRRIREHGAVPIKAPFGDASRGSYPKQADGEHFTPVGHRMIAARLVPRVIAAARQR